MRADGDWIAWAAGNGQQFHIQDRDIVLFDNGVAVQKRSYRKVVTCV